MKYEFIKKHCKDFDISRICRIVEVKRSSFYAWLKRPESKRKKENTLLTEKIKKIYNKSGKRYGSLKVLEVLNRDGSKYGHNRTARLMRENKLFSIVRKKNRNKNRTINEQEASENLLNRNFQCIRLNQVWATDITYIPTRTGWIYLCVFIDLYSRAVVGWSVSRNMKTELVLDALNKAILKRNPQQGLIIHSDRGSQFASNLYREKLIEKGFLQSMSRKGNCWDNACLESFFGIIKNEELFHKNYANIEEVQWDCFKYIDGFYNNVRIHSYLKYLSPFEFEKKFVA